MNEITPSELNACMSCFCSPDHHLLMCYTKEGVQLHYNTELSVWAQSLLSFKIWRDREGCLAPVALAPPLHTDLPQKQGQEEASVVDLQHGIVSTDWL